jgi:hypothetical protein
VGKIKDIKMKSALTSIGGFGKDLEFGHPRLTKNN